MKHPAIERLQKSLDEAEAQIALARECLSEMEEQVALATTCLDETLSRNVDELSLTVRAANCLKGYTGSPDVEIKTVGELVQLTEADLLRRYGLGRESLIVIKEALADLGLSLANYERGGA